MDIYASMLMFSPDMQHVVLIEKNRPAFLAGKLCPVGGRVESDESFEQAAVREFLEETGISTAEADWQLFAKSSTQGSEMACFVSASEFYKDAQSLTDEPVIVMRVEDVLTQAVSAPHKSAPDLIALIGLAMQANLRPCTVNICYSSAKPKPSNRI